MIDVITVRGTGEPMNGPGNMLRAVTRRLDPARFRLIGDCPYPATVGPVGADPAGPSEAQSRIVGVTALAAMVRASPNLVGVIGYSLGALVVDDFRVAQAEGLYPDCQIAWSACVANPARRQGDSIDPGARGYGITGEHRPFAPGVVHLEAANPGDVITSSSAGSPLRTIADTMSAFSFAELGGWSADMADRFRRQRWQPVSLDWWRHPVETWQVYDEAARGILGYLSGREHIRAYIEGGYCERLAARINQQI